MDADQIKRKRQEIVDRFGDWTAHNMYLKQDTYTYEEERSDFKERLVRNGDHLQRIVQIAADITNQPLSSLRVLDLACLEGLYGIEFARHGAEVIGIEGREKNIEKAIFAKNVLELENITFVLDDVRNLSVEKYGMFDVVLCLGILYHLDVPDAFHFLENLSKVCRRVAIIDTHIGFHSNKSFVHNGEEYHGWMYTEFPPTTPKEEKLKWAWASLDNEESFWFTRPSLYKFLYHVGFSSVYSCVNPAVPGSWEDRDTLVAVKGMDQELLSTKDYHSQISELWPEESHVGPHPSQKAYLDGLLPPQEKDARDQGFSGRLRQIARRILGR